MAGSFGFRFSLRCTLNLGNPRYLGFPASVFSETLEPECVSDAVKSLPWGVLFAVIRLIPSSLGD